MNGARRITDFCRRANGFINVIRPVIGARNRKILPAIIDTKKRRGDFIGRVRTFGNNIQRGLHMSEG